LARLPAPPIVTIFIFEFVHGARSSGDWRGYLRRHWFELPSLLPVTGNMVKGAETAPLLRGLRLVRLVRAARLLRIIGAATRLKAIWGKALRVARRAHLFGLALFASFIVLAGAGLAWLVEGSISPHFRGGDALWWSLNMFSNVAYVDFQPEKAAGRLIAALLQFCGIACIGLFTASLASALVTDPGAEPERPEDEPLD